MYRNTKYLLLNSNKNIDAKVPVLNVAPPRVYPQPVVDDDDDEEENGDKIFAVSTFKTQSKQPKKVIIDPKTGLYRPMQSSKNSKRFKSETSMQSGWDGFKSIVYNSVDLLTQNVPKTVEKITKQQQNQEKKANASPPGTMTLSELTATTSTDARNQIVGGYKEREEEFLKRLEMNSSPAKRLAQEFNTDAFPKLLDNSINDLSVPPDPFEAFKSVIYNGIDAVASKMSSASDVEEAAASLNVPSAPRKRLPSSLQTREVQARLLASDEAFLKAMEELQSENPVVRLAAGYKVRRMVEKDGILKKQREQAARRQARIDALKSNIYKTGDAIAAGGKALVELPEKLSKTYAKTVESGKQTLRVVQAVPDEVKAQVESVKQTTKGVQQAVQASLETTKEIIDKTKQFPDKIKTKVQETTERVKKTAEQTKVAVDSIGSVAEQVATRSKVLLGLEKPKPQPPKTKPNEAELDPWSPSQLGWKVLRATGSVAGKVTWFVGKETGKLAWKGAELAINKTKKALEEAAAKEKERQELAKAAFRPKAVSAESETAEATKSVKRGVSTILGEPASAASAVAAEKDTSAKTKEEKQNIATDKNVGMKKDTRATEKEVKEDRSVQRMTQRKEEIELSLLDLEVEIAEALRLAEEAIVSAQTELDEAEEKKRKNKD